MKMKLLFVVALLLACHGTRADSLFTDPYAETLDMQLKLPLDELVRKRRDRHTVAGVLTVDGEVFNVLVTPRGKSRLDRCTFPPLWIEFDKSEVKDTLFHKQKRLKLVTHCKNNLQRRGLLAAEMLAYRIMNVLTDYSYRARAVRMQYVDEKDRPREHEAFFIEHKKRLAKRLDLTEVEAKSIKRSALDPSATALQSLFHYLIGNTDFSFVRGPDGDECCHNIVPMQNEDGVVFPMAYDFDSSGIVNPPYSAPAQNLGLRRFTQRKYRGYCQHNEELEVARQTLIAAKPRVMQMVAEFDDVANLNRSKTADFIDRFYGTIESDRKFTKDLLQRCRD